MYMCASNVTHTTKTSKETIPFNERSGNDIRPNCIVCLFRFIASADKGHRGCISCSQTQYIMVKSRKILSLLLILFYFSPSVYGFLEGLYCGEENCYDGKQHIFHPFPRRDVCPAIYWLQLHFIIHVCKFLLTLIFLFCVLQFLM